MKESRVNIWNYNWIQHNAFTLITTNGYINSYGNLTMGAGNAKQASNKFPGLSRQLAALVRVKGNRVHVLEERKGYRLITFPVKRVWDERADLDLISTSAEQLLYLTGVFKNCLFILPRPGCGNGDLDWEEVKPLLVHLPDNVFVVTNEGSRR